MTKEEIEIPNAERFEFSEEENLYREKQLFRIAEPLDGHDERLAKLVLGTVNGIMNETLVWQRERLGAQAASQCNAINLINYLDEHRPEGKMCFSNGECADFEKAFKEGDWAKVIRYIHKYTNGQRKIDIEKAWAYTSQIVIGVRKMFGRPCDEKAMKMEYEVFLKAMEEQQ